MFRDKKCSIRITREGKILVLIESVLLFAAVNSGKNLLFLMFSVLFSLLLISFAGSKWNLRGLHLSCKGPVCTFAGDTATLLIRIENRSRFPKHLISVTHSGTGSDERIHFFPSRSQTHVSIRKAYMQRGYYDQVVVELETGYPFGFMGCKKLVSLPIDIIVYPGITKIHSYSFYKPSYTFSMGVIPSGEKGVGQELFGLRAYSPGDSLRSIHWRSTARTGTIMVREFEAASRQHFTILLDTGACSADTSTPEMLERNISLAAGFINYLLEKTYPVQLAFHGRELSITYHDSDPGHLFRCLEQLARLQSPEKPQLEKLAESILPSLQPGETIVFVPLLVDKSAQKIARMFSRKGFPVDLIVSPELEKESRILSDEPRIKNIPLVTLLVPDGSHENVFKKYI